MDFNESKRKPPSTRKMLLNQVHENSDMCDVTIKLGLWEKRFHWCVLVASPYFENIRRHSYLERDSGIVSMNIGTSVSLEEGILFLYGKKPKITSTNVEHFLEIAEYLLIPELKAECVHWIKGSRITDDTCLVMIKLSSVYDFNLPTYEEYVLGHIPDLMQTDAMMELTYNSVEYILSDPTLSYVKTTDLFLFLVHWINCRGNRKQHFHKLLKHINFEDVEPSFITDVVINEPLINELDEATDLIESLKSVRCRTTCDILIFPDQYTGGLSKLPCFDLTRYRWSSVNLEQSYSDGFNSHMVREIVAVKGKDHSDVYTFQTSYTDGSPGKVMYSLNLETNNVNKSKLSALESDVQPSFREQIGCIDRNEVFLISNERVECDDNITEDRSTVHPAILAHFMGQGIHFNNMLALTRAVRGGNKRIQVATMYVGKIKEGTTTISVKPILSLRGEMSQICANGTTIVMLSNDRTLVYLFDKENFCIERVALHDKEITLDRTCKLAAAGSGFVIYNDKLFTSVARQLGPDLHSNYLINQYNFPPSKHDAIYTEYLFCENRWYQYSKIRDGQPIFCFTTHEKLMSIAQDRKIKPDEPLAEIWEMLPASESLGPKIFQITLSKERLSCALHCPHCKQGQGTERRYHIARDDDDYYDDDDDSDDDDEYMFQNYGAQFYQTYDFDDCYYYSSD